MRPLTIGKTDRLALAKLVRSISSGAGLVRRACIIVLASEGVSNRQIPNRVGCKPHLLRLRRRWSSM